MLNELLQPVYFDFDKFDLKPETINRLERIAGFLREHSSVRLRAEGHADERGSSEYNMGLGENRSRAVKNYLTSYGISSDRIDLTSYGEERPTVQLWVTMKIAIKATEELNGKLFLNK